jgi:hypothetical protein
VTVPITTLLSAFVFHGGILATLSSTVVHGGAELNIVWPFRCDGECGKRVLLFTVAQILTNWLGLRNLYKLLQLQCSKISRLRKAVRFVMIYATGKGIKALRYCLS